MLTLRSMFATAAVVMSISAFAGQAHAAEVQAPDLDMDAVHRAFWQMKGQSSTAALQWFEQETNRVYAGEGQVSIDARRILQDGRLNTVITGYVDQDGVAGLNPDSDRILFRFAQTGPMVGAQVPYEFLDAGGNVYFRGLHFVPDSPFYYGYYRSFAPTLAYYTPAWRIGYLRPWLSSYRLSAGYISWRTGFFGTRGGYAHRIAGNRRIYGGSVATARLHLSFNARGIRPVAGPAAVRAAYGRPVVSRPAVRAALTRPVLSRPAVRAAVVRPAAHSVATRPALSRPSFGRAAVRPAVVHASAPRVSVHASVRTVASHTSVSRARR